MAPDPLRAFKMQWRGRLWILVKLLTIASAIFSAVILVTSHQRQEFRPKALNSDAGTDTAAWSSHRGRSSRSASPDSLRKHVTEEDRPPPAASASAPLVRTLTRSLDEDEVQLTAHAASGGHLVMKSSSSGARPRAGARMGYLIMLSGEDEVQKTKRLLKAIYHPGNFYLVHLDRKDGGALREDMENFVKDWDNVRMLTPAQNVSRAGYSITLTAIFGICKLVQWSNQWDYFVNLSASDFPLLTQSEMATVLAPYAEMGMNFIKGTPLSPQESRRQRVIVDDQGLFRDEQTAEAKTPLNIESWRPPPTLFKILKGEFWVVLHRSFCEYIEMSPDNVARVLQGYFSKFLISDESYFQTLMCHPWAPIFPVFQDDLRFVAWPPHRSAHPGPIVGGPEGNVKEAMFSGGLFARKFVTEVSEEAYAMLEDSLTAVDPERQARAALRLSEADGFTGNDSLCSQSS